MAVAKIGEIPIQRLVIWLVKHTKDTPRVFILAISLALVILIATSAGYLIERKSADTLSGEVIDLNHSQDALQSQIDQYNAQINSLNDQLQSQKDKYSKLADAVQVEHDSEINAILNKACGKMPPIPPFPTWGTSPSDVNQNNQSPAAKLYNKWSDCAHAQEDSFVQTFIDTHQF